MPACCRTREALDVTMQRLLSRRPGTKDRGNKAQDAKTGHKPARAEAVAARAVSVTGGGTDADALAPRRRGPLARAGAQVTGLVKTVREDLKELRETDASGRRGGGLLRTFGIFVMIPTLLAALYFLVLASDIFASETRFMVRSGDTQQEVGTGTLAMVAKVAGVSGTSPDSFAVLNYVKSRAIIEDVGGKETIFRLYNRDRGDFFATLESDATWEDIVEYWQNRVTASLDTQSGIITVEATAFSAEEADWLARQVVEKSETLVNEISRRAREEALRVAMADVELARTDLAEAREALRRYRNASEIIDPTMTAESIGQVLSQLMIKRIELEARLETTASMIDRDFAPRQVIERELAEVKAQIAEQEGLLASQGRSGGTVSDVVASFENLRLEEEFAANRYSIATSSFERARQETERQQLYLVEIVRPSVPDTALYPRVAAGIFMIFFISFVLWAIASLIVASVKDHAI